MNRVNIMRGCSFLASVLIGTYVATVQKDVVTGIGIITSGISTIGFKKA